MRFFPQCPQPTTATLGRDLSIGIFILSFLTETGTLATKKRYLNRFPMPVQGCDEQRPRQSRVQKNRINRPLVYHTLVTEYESLFDRRHKMKISRSFFQCLIEVLLVTLCGC